LKYLRNGAVGWLAVGEALDGATIVGFKDGVLEFIAPDGTYQVVGKSVFGGFIYHSDAGNVPSKFKVGIQIRPHGGIEPVYTVLAFDEGLLEVESTLSGTEVLVFNGRYDIL